MEIHISDVRTFKRCRRQWGFSSLMQRGLEPVVPYKPFFTGRAIHDCLERYYETGEHPRDVLAKWLVEPMIAIEQAYGEAWPEQMDEWQTEVDLINGMLDHYMLWQSKAEGTNDDRNLRWIATELSFNIPVEIPGHGTHEFAGRMDGVVERISDHTFWLFETKTTRSIKEYKITLPLEEQPTFYAGAAQRVIERPIEGIIYNLMRKKLPRKLELLNNGFLTRDKRADTTLEAYWEAAKVAHPDLSPEALKLEYMDTLLLLEEKGNTFFERYEVRRTQEEITNVFGDVLNCAIDMLDPDTKLYPSPEWTNCRSCRFVDPCLATTRGQDIDYMLSEEYQPREEWVPHQ